MQSDQPLPRWLSSRTASRLGFLRKGNSPDRLNFWCRRPGCNEEVVREPGRGRPKWFHNDKCAVEFSRHRAALDDAISELSEVVMSTDVDVHSRREAEWALRWFLVARSAYVAPTEWEVLASRGVPVNAAAITRLVTFWRLAAGRPEPGSDPCPMCQGSGDLSARRRTIAYEDRDQFQRRVVDDAMVGIKGHLETLNLLVGGSPLTVALEKHLGAMADLSYERMQVEMAQFDPYGEKGLPSLAEKRP